MQYSHLLVYSYCLVLRKFRSVFTSVLMLLLCQVKMEGVEMFWVLSLCWSFCEWDYAKSTEGIFMKPGGQVAWIQTFESLHSTELTESSSTND